MHYFGSQTRSLYYNDFLSHVKYSIIDIIDDITNNIETSTILTKLTFLRENVQKRIPVYSNPIYSSRNTRIKTIYDFILNIIDNITSGTGLGIIQMRLTYIGNIIEEAIVHG